MAKIDIYQTVTDQIIAQLENGTAPWHKSWVGGGLPLRSTGQEYQGINILLLSMQGRSNQNWMTYKQAASLGGQVKSGEKGTMVVCYKSLKIEDKVTNKEKMIPLIKHYNVFNVEQIENLPAKFYATATGPKNTEEKISIAENYISATQAEIRHGGNRAFYSPSEDFIQSPNYDDFDDAVSYYGTMAHELAHWTGHNTRLDRFFKNSDGTKDYAKEELVAEICATYTMAKLGLENTPRPDHASYIASWLKVLKSDPKAIFKACSKAQEACNFLWDLTEESVLELAA